MIWDYVSFALDSILHRGTRSFLTVLGIVIGISAIVALIAIGQGLQSSVIGQFEKLGSNRMLIVPGGIFMGPMSAGFVSSTITERDLKVVQGVNGVEIARGITITSATIKFKGKAKDTMVIGAPTDTEAVKFAEDISFFAVDTGDQLTDSDKYGVIVGSKLGPQTFNETMNVGDKIEINGYYFKVVGIQSSSGTGTYDLMARIPLDTARELFNTSDDFTEIFASINENYQISDVVEKVKEKLRKHRNEKEGEETFSVQTTGQIISGFSTIIGAVQIVMVGIAAVSLIVGGVGIMNSMYTSVLERTRQIGIMKSVGARNSDIMMIFLIEAGVLGTIGGIVGVLGGLGLSSIFDFIAGSVLNISFKAYVSLELIFGALAFAFIVGMASGFLPARRGASMKPTEAMRI